MLGPSRDTTFTQEGWWLGEARMIVPSFHRNSFTTMKGIKLHVRIPPAVMKERTVNMGAQEKG